jgi:hypothetical protein
LAAFPLVSGKNLQKPASKSLLEMLHNTTKLRKISVFYAEIFHMKSPSNKTEILKICDLSKRVSKLKYIMDCSRNIKPNKLGV